MRWCARRRSISRPGIANLLNIFNPDLVVIVGG